MTPCFLPSVCPVVFSWCWSFFVLRADINECERLPQPCAHQCVNTAGSFKCTCPPGRHLLGDGKSCAGLERLPSYESYSYGYRTSQSSPDHSSYQRLYHNLASQSYHSYTATARLQERQRSRSRRETRIFSPQRGFLICQQGFESRGGRCLGNYGSQAGLRWGRGTRWKLFVDKRMCCLRWRFAVKTNCELETCFLMHHWCTTTFSILCLFVCDTNRHQWVWGEGCLSAWVHEHTGEPQVSLSCWLPPHGQWQDMPRWEPPSTPCMFTSFHLVTISSALLYITSVSEKNGILYLQI